VVPIAVLAQTAALVQTSPADRYAAMDRSAAADRSAALVQSVVVPDGVQVVTQKDADRSVQADLRVEVDRSVVTPNGVQVVTHEGKKAQSAVLPSEAQREVRSAVARGVVILIGVGSVALIGFQSLSRRPHAADYSRFLAGLLRVSHPRAAMAALRVLVLHHFAAPVEQLHPMAVAPGLTAPQLSVH